MAEFYFDNLARNLPDVYKKDVSSNNYKILETERTANNDTRATLEEIALVLGLENATGETLDMYGKMLGQARGKAADEQYITMIASKVVRNLTSGGYKEIVDAICSTFGCDKSEVLIKEHATKPMTVSLERAPLAAIIKSGFTTNQAYQIIKSLLPVAVELESLTLEGTFEFAATDNEYSETAGFCDVEGGTLGGYLGAAEGDVNESVLPI